MAKGAGDLVDTINNQSIKLSDSKPSISNKDQHDLICSYNWVNKKGPAVYVPGQIRPAQALYLRVSIDIKVF